MSRSALAVVLLAALSVSVSAQWIRYPTAGVPRTRDGKPDLAAPAPRMADGKPDFSGLWQNDGYGAAWTGGARADAEDGLLRSLVRHEGQRGRPINRGPRRLYERRKDENAKDNPDARCLPIGALQMLAHPLPKKILHRPGLLVILHERNMEFRQIFTDGRRLPDDPQPSWYGYSSGRWEGDTLVVDTVGFRDGLWADFYGSPLTDQARMTERFRRPRFGALEIEVTIDDPKAYTRPWTVTVNQHLGLDLELLEYACLENEKDVPRLVGK